MGFAKSPFLCFETYQRIVIGSDEHDFQMILEQYISYFITRENSPCIYSIKDISENVYTMGDHEGTLQIEYDDIGVKTTHFELTFRTLRFL